MEWSLSPFWCGTPSFESVQDIFWLFFTSRVQLTKESSSDHISQVIISYKSSASWQRNCMDVKKILLWERWSEEE